MITEFSKYRQEPKITYYDNDQKSSEIYYLNGKYHREDGPAEQSWYENGQKQYEYYYLNGKAYPRKEWIEKLKEINSPHYKELIKYEIEFSKYKPVPEIKYYNNGQKASEKYYLNGKKHREDGPASQYWYKNGQKQLEIYCLDGKYHREDGPASHFWYSDGKESEEYYLDDKEYPKQEWIEKLKEIGSPHYKEQKFLYDSEKYNL